MMKLKLHHTIVALAVAALFVTAAATTTHAATAKKKLETNVAKTTVVQQAEEIAAKNNTATQEEHAFVHNQTIDAVCKAFYGEKAKAVETHAGVGGLKAGEVGHRLNNGAVTVAKAVFDRKAFDRTTTVRDAT